MRIRLAKKILKRPYRYSHGQVLAAVTRCGFGKQYDALIKSMANCMDGLMWHAASDEACGSTSISYWTNKRKGSEE